MDSLSIARARHALPLYALPYVQRAGSLRPSSILHACAQPTPDFIQGTQHPHDPISGLILDRARVPVTPFFPGGYTKNLLIVPAWHTDYFSHSNFHFLEKKTFFSSFEY
jgi:hypothetical protein